MIDHIELKSIAEVFSQENKETRENPYEYKEGYKDGFAKAVHLMEVIAENRNLEEINKYQRADKPQTKKRRNNEKA